MPPVPLASVTDVSVAGVKAPQLLWLLPIVPGLITVTITDAVFEQPDAVTVPVTL